MTFQMHPDDVLFFNEVRSAMWVVAKQYELPLKSVEPMAMPEKGMADRLGDCSPSGNIRLVMRCTVDGEFCELSCSPKQVWETASHELAHLRHMNHGPEFQTFWLELNEALQNRNETHREKMIKKLVKMQAQRDGEAKIGNGAAAEAFAGAINRMMIDYELNPSDLDYARGTDDDRVIEMMVDLSKYRINKTKTRVAWQESLARIVSRNHLCTFLLRTGSNQIWFVGTKSHAMVAEYVFGCLVPAADKMSEEARRKFRNECRVKYFPKKDGFPEAYQYREAWLEAFVARVAERLDESRKQAVAETTLPGGESTALMRLSGALKKVDQYIDNKFKARKNSAGSLMGNYGRNNHGAAAGRAAADSMPIGRRGVSGGAKKELGS